MLIKQPQSILKDPNKRTVAGGVVTAAATTAATGNMVNNVSSNAQILNVKNMANSVTSNSNSISNNSMLVGGGAYDQHNLSSFNAQMGYTDDDGHLV